MPNYCVQIENDAWDTWQNLYDCDSPESAFDYVESHLRGKTYRIVDNVTQQTISEHKGLRDWEIEAANDLQRFQDKTLFLSQKVHRETRARVHRIAMEQQIRRRRWTERYEDALDSIFNAPVEKQPKLCWKQYGF